MKKKKKKGIVSNLVVSGVGLGLGSAVVGKLPASTATTNVQSGLTKFAGFYPIFATTAGAGMTMKYLKRMKPKKKRGK